MPERKDSQTMPILKGYIMYLGTGLLVKLRKAKKYNYSEYFEMNKMNIKKIWSGIREIVNIRNNISTKKLLKLNINGKSIDNPKDVANQLNDFFVNVGPLTESSIPRSENISPNKFLQIRKSI